MTGAGHNIRIIAVATGNVRLGVGTADLCRWLVDDKLITLSRGAIVLNAEFLTAMRRIITGIDETAGSAIVLDGPPSAEFAGLYEIWREDIEGRMNPADMHDRGPVSVSLSASRHSVAVRWFVVEPVPDGIGPKKLAQAAARSFASIGAAANLGNQDRDPTMHQTDTLDVICLVSGSAMLVLDQVETKLSPGQVVIQRGTAHAWRACGGPAFFLAVLIGRDLETPAQQET